MKHCLLGFVKNTQPNLHYCSNRVLDSRLIGNSVSFLPVLAGMTAGRLDKSPRCAKNKNVPRPPLQRGQLCNDEAYQGYD